MGKIDLGSLYERAHAIGEKAQRTAYQEAYGGALTRLQRSKPIIDILQQHGVLPFGPMKQRGFYVVIKEENPGFVANVEEEAGKSLDTGTLLCPSGFGDYVNRLAAATHYQKVLAEHRISSEIITIPNPGSREDMAILYIPPTVL